MMRSNATTIYQLKVTLKGSRPPIWRRVLVPADIKLDELHMVLQAVMGWDDDHMHAFAVAGIRYTTPFEKGALQEMMMQDERKVRLSALINVPKQKFEYEYDFGDSWEHTVVLEKILPAEPATHYPVCLAGKRACPPEDCGGVWGYMQLLETLADPDSPEHEEMEEWIGGEFDPEEFDLEAINKDLQRVEA